MTFHLRDYQQRDAERLYDRIVAGRSRTLYRLGTGGGKTAIAGHLASQVVADGGSVLILAHKDFLIDQFAETLHRLELSLRMGIVKRGHKPAHHQPVQVSTIQTMHRRPETLKRHFDLVIVDECHHAAARTWREVIGRYEKASVLGLSATPARTDNKGLGETFREIVSGPENRTLVSAGHRAPIDIVDMPMGLSVEGVKTIGGDYSLKQLDARVDDHVVHAALEAYERVKGRPTVFFGETISHSQKVARELARNGVKACHLDGKTKKDERRRTFQEYANGKYDILCNADLLMEGLDVPTCSAVILHRHTKSIVRYVQMAGRGSRPGESKRTILVDGCDNRARHGHPDDERMWALDMDAPVNLDARPAPGAGQSMKHLMRLAFQTKGNMEQLRKLAVAFGYGNDLAEGLAKQVRAHMDKPHWRDLAHA